MVVSVAVLVSPVVELEKLLDTPVVDWVSVMVDEVCPGLVDGPDVKLAWLVEPPFDDCVNVCEDELDSRVDVGTLEELLVEPPVDDCVAVCT